MFEVSRDALPADFRGALEQVSPRIAVVLGSGFGGLAAALDVAASADYGQIEGFPRPAAGVQGHAGKLMAGHAAGVPLLVFSGRVHMYQGVSALDAAFTARLAAAAGCDTLVVTNAAGGVNSSLAVGDLVVLDDQINLTGSSPLVGWPGPPGGVPFVPMRDAFDPVLRDLAASVAGEHGVSFARGVYAGLLGPAFETEAEVRYLRAIGADVVGMSTVHEVIAARSLGMRVLGLSLVTNAAAGEGLSHEEVLEAGRLATERLGRLLPDILQRL